MANKIGTYMLSLAAFDNHVPAYAVVPTSTIDLSLAHGGLIPIEERDPDEALGLQFHGERVAPKNARARNPAFDVTPNRLISAIVTENGIVYPPFDSDYLTHWIRDAENADKRGFFYSIFRVFRVNQRQSASRS